MKKLFTLITLLVAIVTGASAAADITYALTSFTESPAGTFTYEFSEAAWKNKEIWVEVPSASVSGTVNFKCGSAKERYQYIFKTAGTVKDETRKVKMSSGYAETPVSYTSSDILTDGGKYYLVFKTSDDFKSTGIKYTVPAAPAKSPAISPSSQSFYEAFDATITKGEDNSYFVYTTDGTEPAVDGEGNVTNGTKVTGTSTTVNITAGSDKTIKAYGYNSSNEKSYLSQVVYNYVKVFSANEFVDFATSGYAKNTTFNGVYIGEGCNIQTAGITIDGYNFTKRVQPGGDSQSDNRYFSFKVMAPCNIVVYHNSNSAGHLKGFNISVGDTYKSGDGTTYGCNAGGVGEAVYYNVEGTGVKTINISNGKVGSSATTMCIYGFKVVFGNTNAYTTSITSAGYATLALPYAVTIPSGVKAYTGSVSGGGVSLTQISDGIIPANTGVVLEGAAGSYTFNETTEAGTASSDLSAGAAGNSKVIKDDATDSYYVLIKDGDNVCFAKVTNADYKVVPSNKAYVQVAAGGGDSLPVNFSEVTAVQNVEAAPQANEAQVGKKAFVNGQLVIITENGYVNALGQTVK